MRNISFLLFTIVLTSIAVLLCFPVVTHSQSCEKWDQIPTVCRQFVHAEYVYMVPGVSIQTLIYWTGILPLVASTSPTNVSGDYILWVLDMFCQTYLRPCYINPLNGTVMIKPVNPCLSFCRSFEYHMRKYLDYVHYSYSYVGYGMFNPNETVNGLTLNCTTWINDVPNIGSPYFTETGYNFTTDGNEVMHVPCLEANNITYDEISVCSGGFEQDLMKCYYTCPMLPITKDQYDNDFEALHLSMGSLGIFICIASLLLSLISYKKYLTYPGYHALTMDVSCIILALSIMGTYILGKEEVWCDGGKAYAFNALSSIASSPDLPPPLGTNNDYVENGPKAVAQGFFIYTSLLCVLYGATCILVNVIEMLSIRQILKLKSVITKVPVEDIHTKETWIEKWKVYYLKHLMLLGYIVVILVGIGLAGSKSFKFYPGATFAFLDATNDTTLFVIFFICPLALLSIATLLSSVIILCMLPSYIRNMSKKGKRFIQIMGGIRHMMMGLLFSIIMVCLVIIFIYQGVYFGDNVNKIISDYATDVLLYGKSDPYIDQTTYELGIVIGVFLMMLPILKGSSGILGWILFSGNKLSLIKYLGNSNRSIINPNEMTINTNTMDIEEEEEEEEFEEFYKQPEENTSSTDENSDSTNREVEESI